MKLRVKTFFDFVIIKVRYKDKILLYKVVNYISILIPQKKYKENNIMKRNNVKALVLSIMLVITMAFASGCEYLPPFIKDILPGGHINSSTTENPEAEVLSIELDTSNVKTEFIFGEPFTYEGLKVTAKMSDGTTQLVNLDDCTISTPDMTASGSRVVNVRYEGKIARYQIQIRSKKIPTISQTPLLTIEGEKETEPYRVEAESIDMSMSHLKKPAGATSFVGEVSAEETSITSGNQYLTNYGVVQNYFGFTFTSDAEYVGVTMILRVANPTDNTIDLSESIKMYMDHTTQDDQDFGEVEVGPWQINPGALAWTDVILHNIVIPQGTHKLSFEVLSESVVNIDYIDFLVGMDYVNDVIEFSEQTTIIKEFEDLDTEKAFTREDVAAHHGLKAGQLFVETPYTDYPSNPTSGGKSVGALGPGSQLSTTLRLAEPATIKISFDAVNPSFADYYLDSDWKFHIDGYRLEMIEHTLISAGGREGEQWWNWQTTSLGVYNLPAGDHLFTVIAGGGGSCNVDHFTFEVISWGEYDETGKNLDEQLHKKTCESPCPLCGKCLDEECEHDVCVEKCDCKYDGVLSLDTVSKSEAETWSMEGVITREDHLAIGTPAGTYKTEFGNGQTCIFAIGDGTVFTLKLYVVEAGKYQIALHGAQGGDASTLKFTMDGVEVSATGSLATAPGAYHDWQTMTLDMVELTKGEHTFVINFVNSNGNIDGVTFTPEALISNHACENACPECGKCLNAECAEEVCADKCQGHEATCACVKCGKCISGCEGHEQCDCPFDVVLSATETVKSEAETWSMEGVITREDHLAIGTPAGTYKTEFGNGQTCIYAIGNGTVFTLKLSVPVEGDWNIVMIGTQGGPASNLKFTMDGVEIAASGDYSTAWGEWHDWREVKLDTVHLTQGVHTFVINFVSSNGNIDGITFTHQ